MAVGPLLRRATVEVGRSTWEIRGMLVDDRRGSVVRALAVLAGGHLVAIGVAVLWLRAASVLRSPGGLPSVEQLAQLIGAGTFAIAVLVAASIVAARIVGHARPVRRALAGVVGLVLGALGVTALVVTIDPVLELGSFVPPVAGVGLGVQLAVLLPPTSTGRLAVRAAIPVLVDVVAGLTLNPSRIGGLLGIVVALGWFALALCVTALTEPAGVRDGSAPARP